VERPGAPDPDASETHFPWPVWVRVWVSVALLFHFVAIGSAAWVVSEAPWVRSLDSLLRPYHQVIEQGHSYTFYRGGAPPTPILEARLTFEDGRVEELRVPDRSVRPRLRFQRRLALAYHLFNDVRAAPRDPRTNRTESRWAASYARHLCRTRPDCRSVTLTIREHRNPTPEELIRAAEEGRSIDPDDPRYFPVPPPLRSRYPDGAIGTYRCEEFAAEPSD